MNEENDQKLVTTFPELYWQRFLPMNQTCLCWGFDCGDGWFDIIWELSEKISPLVKTFNAEMQKEWDALSDEENKLDPEPPIFGVVQVKEKFGGLRYYTNYYTKEIQDIIDEYENKSYDVCEVCGQPGEIRNLPWIRTLCQKHYVDKVVKARDPGPSPYHFRDTDDLPFDDDL
jgi:hypothetical protein